MSAPLQPFVKSTNFYQFIFSFIFTPFRLISNIFLRPSAPGSGMSILNLNYIFFFLIFFEVLHLNPKACWWQLIQKLRFQWIPHHPFVLKVPFLLSLQTNVRSNFSSNQYSRFRQKISLMANDILPFKIKSELKF